MVCITEEEIYLAMSTHDCLVDRFATIFAVNCDFDEEEQTLTVGALFLEPGLSFSNIRISDRTANIEIELPPDLLNVPTAQKAWNIQLPAKL